MLFSVATKIFFLYVLSYSKFYFHQNKRQKLIFKRKKKLNQSALVTLSDLKLRIGTGNEVKRLITCRTFPHLPGVDRDTRLAGTVMHDL